MAVKPILKLSIAFGRLHVPVGLVPVKRDGAPGLRTLHRDCQTRVSLLLYCKRDERVLEKADTIHAFELAEGEYLTVEDEELDATVAAAGGGLELVATVASEEIDPLWVRGAYYLAPGKHPLGLRAYALFRAALSVSGTVAIGRYRAWDAEHLCTIAPRGDGTLVLRNLYFADDRLDANAAEIADTLHGLDVDVDAVGAATDLALALRKQLRRIDQGSRQREQLAALLEAKLAGAAIVRPDPPGELEQAPLAEADFTAALRESIRDVRRRPRTRKPAAARE